MTVAAGLDVSDCQPNPEPLPEKLPLPTVSILSIFILGDYTSQLGYTLLLEGPAANQILSPKN